MKPIAWLVILASLGCDENKSTSDAASAPPTAKAPASDASKNDAKAKPAQGNAESDPSEAKPSAAKPGAAKPGSEPEPEPETPAAKPTEISGTRALVLTDKGLQRLSPSGATELLAATTATECDTDDEHDVVWLVSATEISAYDRRDKKVHTVANLPASSKPADGGPLSWQVHRPAPGVPFPFVAAGNVDGLEVCVALAVVVSKTPSVSGAIVAEGDREVYCFEDDGEEVDFDKRKLNPDESATKTAYDQARVTDSGFLVALHERHVKDGARKRASLKPPAAPTVTVDPTRCDASPDDCGTATYLGGQRLWSVITDNSRGDFYHETTQLYDGKTATFWNPLTDVRAPKAPADPGESSTLDVSPDGRWGVVGAKIVATADAKVTGEFNGALCGWE